MLSIVTDMGMGRVAIVGVLDESRDRESFAGTYIVLRTVLGVVGYLVAMVVVMVAGNPAIVVQATAIAGVVVLLSTPSAAYNVAFQAHLKLGAVAVAEVLGRAAHLALIVAVALAGGSLLWFLVPAVVAEIVTLGVKLPSARRLVAFRYSVQLPVWLELAREAVPLSIGGALLTLYFRIDSIMLSKLDTFTAVGTYGVAYKFADLAHFVATALTVPILTLLVRSWPDDLPAFRSAIRRGAGFLAFFAGLLVIEFALFAEPVIVLLYGEDYKTAGLATGILVGSTSIAFFSSLALNALIAAERHRVYPFITAAGLVINVVLNLILIPRHSFDGAAVATLATEIIVVSLLWWRIGRMPGVPPIGLAFLGRTVAAAAVAFSVGLGIDVLAPWPVAAVVAAIVYVGSAQLLRSTGPAGLLGLIRS